MSPSARVFIPIVLLKILTSESPNAIHSENELRLKTVPDEMSFIIKKITPAKSE